MTPAELIKALEEAVVTPVGNTVMLPQTVIEEAIAQLKHTRSSRELGYAIAGSAKTLNKGLTNACATLLIDECNRIHAARLTLKLGGVNVGEKEIGDWKVTVRKTND